MKNLTLLLLLLLLLLFNCNVTKQQNNPTEPFNITANVVYYDGTVIGHLDAIKMEREGKTIRKEISIVMINNSFNQEIAPKLIDWIVTKRSYNDIDIEIKFNY